MLMPQTSLSTLKLLAIIKGTHLPGIVVCPRIWWVLYRMTTEFLIGDFPKSPQRVPACTLPPIACTNVVY